MAGDLRYIFNIKFILVQDSAGKWFVFKCQKQFFVNTSQWQLNEPSSISPTLIISLVSNLACQILKGTSYITICGGYPFAVIIEKKVVV